MADTGENFANITNDLLGFGSMAFDSTVAQLELTYGANYAVGLLAAIATLELSVPAAVAIGLVVGNAAGPYLDAAIASALNGGAAQAQILGAVNLDGQGLAMPDPVTGMGYWG